jgi:hypothetical protein
LWKGVSRDEIRLKDLSRKRGILHPHSQKPLVFFLGCVFVFLILPGK